MATKDKIINGNGLGKMIGNMPCAPQAKGYPLRQVAHARRSDPANPNRNDRKPVVPAAHLAPAHCQ